MSKSSVQYSRGYFRTQKITKNICISSQQHAISKKVPLEQNLSNSERGKKQEGKQEESRAKVGQMSTIEKNSICKFVWNFNFLLSVWNLDESSQRIRKQKWTCQKNLNDENNPPDRDN